MFARWHLVLVASVGVAWVAQKVIKLIIVRRWFKNLPQPPGHNFLSGHLAAMTEASQAFPPGTHPQYFYTYLAHKYKLPGIFYIDLWPLAVPQIVITDPDIAMQILTVNPFPKHPQIEVFLQPFTGKGSIAASNGDRWKYNHRMVGGGFTASHIKSMINMISEEGFTFHNRFKEMAERGDAIALEEETSKAIFDVVGKIVFGFSLEAQKTGSPLLEDLRATIDPATAVLSSFSPMARYKSWRKLRDIRKRVHDSLSAEIRKRGAIMKDEKELPSRRKAKSIMDRIILDRMQDEPNAPLNQEFLDDVITNLKALLLGGHGTTTSTFTFAIMFLSLHPDILARLRQEHDDIFDPDFETTIEIINSDPSRTNKLDLTNAVIKETLRFYPIGFTIRSAPAGVKFIEHDGNKWPVAHGAMVIPSAHTTQMDTSLWKDPNCFRPDRFLGEEGASQHRFAWRPFERGPRACIAQDLAMDELRVMLLLVVRWFDFELVGETQNKIPRVGFMDLDERIGDLAFQVVGMEAKPNKAMRFKVRPSGRP
ncbi:unnamed protein product [Clonostachys rosea]|uniref:Cytochrome P450 n=1 Tax=Bionectria ochroleuca TaxID=29856 RepID=A0ABY6URS3_BIOOC|nr:unnamed protein product [Clonostachys rosea]